MPLGFMGCQTSKDHQAHNFYRFDNWIQCKISAHVIYGYDCREEEESNFEMVYDLLNSDELFGRYVKFYDFFGKVHMLTDKYTCIALDKKVLNNVYCEMYVFCMQ
mgnify:CR=1 FL=1